MTFPEAEGEVYHEAEDRHDTATPMEERDEREDVFSTRPPLPFRPTRRSLGYGTPRDNVDEVIRRNEQLEARITRLEDQLQRQVFAPTPTPRVSHSTIKPKKPDNWNGKSDTLLDFFSDMQRYLSKFVLTEEEKISEVIDYSGRKGKSWIHSLCAAKKTSQPFDTYIEFRQAMAKRFLFMDVTRAYIKKLEKLKQRTAVAEYTKEFEDCLAYITNMHPRDKIIKYLAGLKESVKQKVQDQPSYIHLDLCWIYLREGFGGCSTNKASLASPILFPSSSS